MRIGRDGVRALWYSQYWPETGSRMTLQVSPVARRGTTGFSSHSFHDSPSGEKAA